MMKIPTIPGYDILAEIGRGDMGVVYRARQLPLNRIVAIKLISNPDSQSNELLRLRQEAELIARLQHPNIVQIFETGVVDRQPFLVIEYVDGVTLKQRTAGVPQPAYETARLLETIARAAHHAHECRIIHRDLKPQNILLSATGVPKVTDFGLARSLDVDSGLTLSTDFLGTPAYAAPEQVLNQLEQVGPHTDVYAMGAMLYELLTGHVPFQADSLQKLLRQVAEADPTPIRRLVSSCPRDLQTICMKCLEKPPSNRYASALELAEDLRRFQADEPIHARQTGIIERGYRWARRNPTVAGMLMLVIGILLASAIGGGILSMHLATALRTAQDDRDRVAESERQMRVHLAASRAAAAKLALQRGNGRVALEQIDAAHEAGLDTTELRFLRIKALCTIHDAPRALEMIRTLAESDDLGPWKNQIMLWKTDLELDSGQIEVETGVQQIRQLIEQGLPIAEQHYANGLIAKSIPSAIEHFREAALADPTNPRTNTVLAMLLVLAGEFPEAGERLVAAKLLFPEHPVIELIDAVKEAFQENPTAVNEHLAKLQLRLPDTAYREAESIIRFCENLTSFVRVLEKAQCQDPDVNQLSALWKLQSAIQRIQANGGRATKGVYLPFPPGLLKEFRTATNELPNVNSLLIPRDRKALVKTIEKMTEWNPDAFFSLYAGTQQAYRGETEDWLAASKLFERATKHRSMLPVQRMALFAAATAESILERDGPTDERALHRARSLQYIAEWSELNVLPQQANLLLDHCERMHAPPELSWRIYAAWERANGQDVRLPFVRAKLYLRAHDYEAAIQLADEHLMESDDPKWSRLRDEARAELRRQSEAVLKKP